MKAGAVYRGVIGEATKFWKDCQKSRGGAVFDQRDKEVREIKMLCGRRFISIVVIFSLSAAALIAQHSPPATETNGEFAVLIDGLGNYSRPISTKSELAQKFFDQGLRLVYGYYSPEATASFKEAVRHDPDNPMPYWGLALNPNHPGAVHLYIHLYESSAEPERALPKADRLESLMPKAGHMVHMPSHIYVRTGDYEKAIASNQRSLKADGLFQKEWGDRATPNLGSYGLSSRTHARHAWDFIRYAAMLAGNYERAMEAAKATAAGQSHQGMGATRTH